VPKVILGILIPGDFDLSFCESSFHSTSFFTLSHFCKSSPTLLQEISLLLFHMPKKWPEMNMGLDWI